MSVVRQPSARGRGSKATERESRRLRRASRIGENSDHAAVGILEGANGDVGYRARGAHAHGAGSDEATPHRKGPESSRRCRCHTVQHSDQIARGLKLRDFQPFPVDVRRKVGRQNPRRDLAGPRQTLAQTARAIPCRAPRIIQVGSFGHPYGW